jgi:hypothetical protein
MYASYNTLQLYVGLRSSVAIATCYALDQCFSAFVRPRPVFFFNKTRARSQQIIGLQPIFMTGHKQRYSLSRMLKYFDVWKFPIIREYFRLKIRDLVTDISNADVV